MNCVDVKFLQDLDRQMDILGKKKFLRSQAFCAFGRMMTDGVEENTLEIVLRELVCLTESMVA
jgi:hypothetical protein